MRPDVGGRSAIGSSPLAYSKLCAEVAATGQDVGKTAVSTLRNIPGSHRMFYWDAIMLSKKASVKTCECPLKASDASAKNCYSYLEG